MTGLNFTYPVPVKSFLCLLILICVLFSNSIKAQNADSANKASLHVVQADTTNAVIADTVKLKKFQPNPKKAGLYSAILPGAGQFYNKQYWKIPVIYAGLAVAGYFINDNLSNYLDFRKAYVGSINNPNRTDKYVNIYNTAQLKQLQDDYSKFLDLSVLFTCVGYLAQIIDAVAFAHLHNFDMSDNLSLKIKPVACPQGAGIGLVVNFK